MTPPPAARPPFPPLWAGVLLATAIELATVFTRFGLGLESTHDTAFLAPFTLGLRIHHGYLGVVALLCLLLPLAPRLQYGLVVLGVALVLSDLVHHFLVLWPLTGSPQFHLVYPP